MSSQIDFVISAGIFIVFMATILIFMTNTFVGNAGLQTSSEMRTAAFDTYGSLFGGQGLPANWENNNYPPRVFGLITNLYRTPLLITEANQTARANISINVTIAFDSTCESRAWNNTVRVYDSNNVLIPVTLFNQNFCSSQFLNSSDIVFNATLGALESKFFFVYYSDDKNVTGSTYSLDFTGALNVSGKQFPEIKIPVVSTAKLRALRNYNYEDFSQILGGGYNTYVETSVQ